MTHLEDVNRLAAMPVPTGTVSKLMADNTLSEAISRIASARRYIGLKLEEAFAKTITSRADPWAAIETFKYHTNYQELARMEYEGAELKNSDRVVFLGSGPLPMTLICLSKRYGLRGVGIEQNEELAALSENVIRNLGLSHRITILHDNHYALPLKKNYALIMVGADAVPKEAIFAHLAKVFPAGQQFSYRIYEKGLRRLLDDLSSFRLPSRFLEINRVHPNPPVNNTCVFLRLQRCA